MPAYTMDDIRATLTEAQKKKIIDLTNAFFAMACAIAMENNRKGGEPE